MNHTNQAAAPATAANIVNLLPHHRRELCEMSGLAEETIFLAGIQSQANAAAIRAVLNWPNMPARMGVPIVFRFRDSDGRPNGYCRFKPDSPRVDAKTAKPIQLLCRNARKQASRERPRISV